MRRSNYILLLVIGMFCGLGLKAQQIPLYSNYFFTPYIYNPALSGTEGVTELTLMHRRQWTGIQGSPETSALAINGSLNSEQVGWSVYGFTDKANIVNRMGLYGNYAYHLELSSTSTLSFGLGAGYLNTNIDQEAVRAQDVGDVFTAADTRRGVFDLSAGVNLTIENLQIGAAAPQLLAQQVDFTDDETSIPVNFNLIRHYTFNASYDFKFDGDKRILTPMVMVRAADGVDMQIDAGAMFRLKEYGYVGAMFRSNYAVTANVGVNLSESLTFGYAYDFSTNEFASSLGTSHEFMLTYRFGSNKDNERIENELKRLKREQREQRDETEEVVDEKLEEFKESYKKDLEKQVEEATKKEREELQRQIEQNQQSGESAGQQRDSRSTGGGQRGGQGRDNRGGSGSEQSRDNRVNQNVGDRQTSGSGGGGRQSGGYDASNQASNVDPGSKGYYVIAGVFSSQSNAENLVNKLSNQGFSANYFQDQSNYYYYVYLLKFDSYQQADQAKASNMNGRYNGDLWIKIVE